MAVAPFLLVLLSVLVRTAFSDAPAHPGAAQLKTPPWASATASKAQAQAEEELATVLSEKEDAPLPAPWYEGLDGVKVLRPTDPNLQEVVDAIFKEQDGWHGHFNSKRYAILLTPGEYPDNFVIPVTYYTSVLGVGKEPQDVTIKAVRSLNGANGHATNNFWRSFEGMKLTNQSVTWAVSQGAPARRAHIEGLLFLSDGEGYSSGGFLADIKMKGTIMAGMQQQWFFRNLNMPGGIYCPTGWNYVFVGIKDVLQQTYEDCEGAVTAKVTVVEATPRIAEKPYLVQDNDAWQIYVPAFAADGVVGAVDDHEAALARKLDIDREVFVAKPGHTEQDINNGIRGKSGLLITPGVYEFEHPVVIKESGFVVLGIGMATLVSTKGKPALEVLGGLSDVRVAGLLLEAGTPNSKSPTEPMLRWGARNSSIKRPPADNQLPAGVLSDVFARVGAFKYRNCSVVRADTMIEVNSDDVVLDNTWLWHADHDDCGTDPDGTLDVIGKSDQCFSKHGLVVTGDGVTAYGLSVEHTLGGDMVSWRGDRGEVYFYQCELPYHNDSFSANGFVGYAVGPEVISHKARGMGVYIISAKGVAESAYRLPASTDAENLITVVVIGETEQFANLLCLSASDGDSGDCFGGQTCVPEMRCLLPSMPWSAGGAARLFLDGPVRRESANAANSAKLHIGGGLPLLCVFAVSMCGLVAIKARHSPSRHVQLDAEACE